MKELNAKYILAVLPSLYRVKEIKALTGEGYSFSCPFCSGASAKHEATLVPLTEKSVQWMFGCKNGMRIGSASLCNKRMRLEDFLALWNPPLHRRYMRERLTPSEYKEWKRYQKF